jgi:protein O-mannosyl-transferase
VSKKSANKKQPALARQTPPKKEDPSFVEKYAVAILSLVVLVVYFTSFSLGYTELDDSIFIRDFHTYNENLGNLLTSFHRGVFSATNDEYYRPLFLDSILLNYQIGKESIMSYHIINVIIHLLAVLVLFKLFEQLGFGRRISFFISLVFAVHPVLTQAVSWIPGRNDSMLGLLAFSAILFNVRYADEHKTKWLVLQILFLLLAFFTKETSVFIPPAIFIVLVLMRNKKLFERAMIILYGSWIGVFIFWYWVRSQATVVTTSYEISTMLKDFGARLPVFIQYLGKIIFPFNLSVFPMQQDTNILLGMLALVVLAVLIFLSKEKNWKIILAGAGFYIITLTPSLMVPKIFNEQEFEHRLYLPIVGILILLTQTAWFKNLKPQSLLASVVVVAVIFSFINIQHQKSFGSPITFWRSAVSSSPSSAYAAMMYGAREMDSDKVMGEAWIRKSFRMDSDQKYINYYYGKILCDHDSTVKAEPYLRKELKLTGFNDVNFLMAHVVFNKNEFDSAIYYLKTYLAADPSNPQGNNNLLMLYLQTGKKQEAREQAARMQQQGLSVSNDLLKQLQ